jgi:hypothetical protein
VWSSDTHTHIHARALLERYPVQPLPDLLSTKIDYDRNMTGNVLSPLPTSCTLLAHKDVRYVSVAAPVPLLLS